LWICAIDAPSPAAWHIEGRKKTFADVRSIAASLMHMSCVVLFSQHERDDRPLSSSTMSRSVRH
jgi:hypothetical protein